MVSRSTISILGAASSFTTDALVLVFLLVSFFAVFLAMFLLAGLVVIIVVSRLATACAGSN